MHVGPTASDLTNGRSNPVPTSTNPRQKDVIISVAINVRPGMCFGNVHSGCA